MHPVKTVKNRAFTLVEMLFVIVIILILVVIAFPTVGNLRTRSEGVKCMGNLKNIVSAFMSYAGDNNGALPPYGDFSGVFPPWWESLSPYLGGTPLAPCHPGVNVLRCPSVKDETRFGTYGVNYGYSSFAPISYLGSTDGDQTFVGSMRLPRIHGNTFLVGDMLDPNPGGGSLAIYSPLVAGGWVLNSDRDGDGIPDSHGAFTGPYNYFDPRHNGVGYCGFFDGSIRAVTGKDWATNQGGMWGEFN